MRPRVCCPILDEVFEQGANDKTDAVANRVIMTAYAYKGTLVPMYTQYYRYAHIDAVKSI